MKRLLILIFILLFAFSGAALAATDKYGVLITEPDGTPDGVTVYELIVPDGTASITNGVLTLSVMADINESNIYYVGKHGNDSNDGLTIGQAKLTFQAAITAASSGDVVYCTDGGTYTENLTGASGIDIYAPNATIAGAHTVTTDNEWTFGTATVATDTIGFTMNTASQEAHLTLEHLDIAAYTGSLTAGAVSLAGKLFIDVEHVDVGANSYGLGSTSTDELYINFGEIDLAGGATAIGVAAAGDINATGRCIEDGANSGTLVYSTNVASSVHMVIAKVDLTILSNIGATPDVSLVVADLAGTLTESGVGAIFVGGSDVIRAKSFGIKGSSGDGGYPYGMDANGVLYYSAGVPDEAAEPGFTGYDAQAAGDYAAAYAGKMGWQMMVITNGSEETDHFTSYMRGGAEERYIWWDAGYTYLYLGVMTDSDTPEDVSGLEAFYFHFNYDTNIIGVLPKADASTTGMVFDGLTLDASTPHTISTGATITVTGSNSIHYAGDNDAIHYDLPLAASGDTHCFANEKYTAAITIDPDDNDQITLVGVEDSAGDSISCTATVGQSVCLHGATDGRWIVWGPTSTWTAD